MARRNVTSGHLRPARGGEEDCGSCTGEDCCESEPCRGRRERGEQADSDIGDQVPEAVNEAEDSEASPANLVGEQSGRVDPSPVSTSAREIPHTTGHTYNDLARMLAVALAATVGLGTAVRGLRRGSHAGATEKRLVLFRWLAPLQVLGFSALEIQERVAVGAPLTELIHGHEFAIGLAVQVAVAAVAVLAIALTERVAAAVAAGCQSPQWLGVFAGPRVTSPSMFTDLRWWSALLGRGPPADECSQLIRADYPLYA